MNLLFVFISFAVFNASQSDRGLPTRTSDGATVVTVQRRLLKRISPHSYVRARRAQVCVITAIDECKVKTVRLKHGLLKLSVSLPTVWREYADGESITAVTSARVRVVVPKCGMKEFAVTGGDDAVVSDLTFECSAPN
jgi:hypothetical protein